MPRVMRQRDLQARPVVELDQEVLVFVFVAGPEKCLRREARSAQLVAHAATGIEHEPDGDRFVVHGELRDGLLDAFVENAKIFLLQPGHGAVQRVVDRNRDQHQVGVDA